MWLKAELWPGQEERAAWRGYRTVHQAVRCAIQEIVAAGERYNGVFSQVRRVHEYIERHTVFSKQQVRQVSHTHRSQSEQSR